MKNIFRYLKGSTSLGLWYPSKTRFFIQAYLDDDIGVVILIEKAQVADVNYLMENLCAGNQRNKHVFRFRR